MKLVTPYDCNEWAHCYVCLAGACCTGLSQLPYINSDCKTMLQPTCNPANKTKPWGGITCDQINGAGRYCLNPFSNQDDDDSVDDDGPNTYGIRLKKYVKSAV